MSFGIAALARGLAALSGRERGLVLALGLIALPLGFWLGIAEPIMARQADAVAEWRHLEAEAAWLAREQQRLARLPAPPETAAESLPLAESLAAAGLVAEIRSSAGGSTELRFDDAGFAALMRWLAATPGIESVTITPGAGGELSGLVSARVEIRP